MNEKEILEIKKKVIEMKNTLTGLSIQERISEPEGGLVKILTLKSKAGGKERKRESDDQEEREGKIVL